MGSHMLAGPVADLIVDARCVLQVSITYAGIVQAYLRQGASQLPVWDKRRGAGFWRLLTVREGRQQTFFPPSPVAAAASSTPAGSSGSCTQAFDELQATQWLVSLGGGAVNGAIPLDQVTEAEPAAPAPDEVLLMVQVNPNAAEQQAARRECQQLSAFIRQQARERGLPAASLMLQHHSGVSNAASFDAPIMQMPEDTQDDDGATVSAAARAAIEAPYIHDALCNLKFRISPTAFFQVNSPATCLLYHMAGQWAAANPNTLVFDICCGTGTIGLTVARRVARVVGIDNVASAIEDAKVNCALNDVSNCDFVCGKAEDVMNRLLNQYAGQYTDVVAIADPPRAGLHRTVLRAIRRCSALRRLVFIACNPASIVANVADLCMPRQNEGEAFKPVKAVAVDLFPHTAHVESMVLLQR